MQVDPATSFTADHSIGDDGVMTFVCSDDLEKWPWLALHPFDPIVVQSINFWASVETGTARGTFDPAKWSALTQMQWECGEEGAGHATRGIAAAPAEPGEGYRLTFFDCKDRLVYRMSGIGVVFENRDFEAWRAATKRKLAESRLPEKFEYESAEAVGVTRASESFVSPLLKAQPKLARALITQANGFPPAHPFLSGSGDHVNSTHLADVARQFGNLVRGRIKLPVGGEMEFHRYVELNHPFEIVIDGEDGTAAAISMQVSQNRRSCAKIRLLYRIG